MVSPQWGQNVALVTIDNRQHKIGCYRTFTSPYLQSGSNVDTYLRQVLFPGPGGIYREVGHSCQSLVDYPHMPIGTWSRFDVSYRNCDVRFGAQLGHG